MDDFNLRVTQMSLTSEDSDFSIKDGCSFDFKIDDLGMGEFIRISDTHKGIDGDTKQEITLCDYDVEPFVYSLRAITKELLRYREIRHQLNKEFEAE